jgi:hypothetical protein
VRWVSKALWCSIRFSTYEFLEQVLQQHSKSVNRPLHSYMTTGWLTHGVDTMVNGMMTLQDKMEWDSRRFHHATQNDAKIKTYYFFLEISP